MTATTVMPVVRKLRRLARVSVDRTASLAGLLALTERAMRGRLTVLTYHRVLPDELCRGYLFSSLAVPETLFRAQTEVLAKRYRVLTLADGLAALRAGDREEQPLVSMTFDDGYADNFRVAAPILQSFGLPATFFVVAGLIGTDGELWYDVAARRWEAATSAALADAALRVDIPIPWQSGKKPTLKSWMTFLKRLTPQARGAVIASLADPGRSKQREEFDRLMTPDELCSLRNAGHEIGSHTLTHPLLPQLDDAALKHELVGSRHLIEGWLNAPVVSFCYPNGDCDERVTTATAAAGYTHACLTHSGDNRPSTDPLRLRRVDMHPSRSRGTDDEFDEPSFRATISRLHELRR